MKWLELTAPQVKELVHETDVVLLPIGSIESHGPHMPSGADGYVAERIAVEAARIEKAIVFPTLFLNSCSPGKPLPGVEFELRDPFISFPPSLVSLIVRQICLEVARVGFKKVLCIGGHGPTSIPLNSLQFELQEEAQSLARMGRAVPLVFWVDVWGLCGDAGKALGLGTEHGGAWETSLTAACVPGLVDLEKARSLDPYLVPPRKVQGVHYTHNWPKEAPRGYQGRPCDATLEAGEKILKTAVERLAGMIRELKGYNVGCDI